MSINLLDVSKPYYLYVISNNIDNSKYIGITSNINRRKREHFNNTSNKHLRIAFEVFGKDNFTFTVLYESTLKGIDTLEKETIKKYLDNGEVLYNVSKGGLIGNGSPGEEHWNHELEEEDIIHIRNMYASNKCTQRDLAILYNTGYKNISKIVRGERWTNIGGPITTVKQNVSKVANRRKLTDTQVIQVRSEALEEYNILGSIDITEIAELYGVSRGNMRMLLKGITYKQLPGPILGIDYYKDFGHGS